MCTNRLWECSDIHRREGKVKVHAAFWRDLIRPFEHKVDSWKETLFRKHFSVVARPEKQQSLARAVSRARLHVVGRVRSSTSVKALRDAILHIYHAAVKPHLEGYLQALARFADTISVDWAFASSARVHVAGPQPLRRATAVSASAEHGLGEEEPGDEPDGEEDSDSDSDEEGSEGEACAGSGGRATRATGKTQWRVAPSIATVVGRYGFILQPPMFTGLESAANLAWVLGLVLCRLKGHLRERGPAASHPSVITVDNLKTHQHALQAIIDVHFPLLQKGVVRFAVDPWHFACRVAKAIPKRAMHQDGPLFIRLWFDTVEWIRTPALGVVSPQLLLPEAAIARQRAALDPAEHADIQAFIDCACRILQRKTLSDPQKARVQAFLIAYGWSLYGLGRAVGAAARLRKHAPLALAAACATSAGMLLHRGRGEHFTPTQAGLHPSGVPILPLHIGPCTHNQASAASERTANLFRQVWAPQSRGGAGTAVQGRITRGILDHKSSFHAVRARVKASLQNDVGLQGLLDGRDAVHGATTTGGNESLHSGMRHMVSAGTSTRLDVADMILTLYWLEKNQATAAKLLSKDASGECRQEETRSKSQDVAATLEFCSVLTGDVGGFARGALTAALQSCPDAPAPTTFEEAKASGLPLYHKASSSVTPEVEEDNCRLLMEEREAQEAKTARYSPNTAASRIASAAHATVGQVERVASKVQREEEQFAQWGKRSRQHGLSQPSAKCARC